MSVAHQQEEAKQSAQADAAASQVAAANSHRLTQSAQPLRRLAPTQTVPAPKPHAAKAQADAAAANQRAANSEQSAEALRKKLRDQLNAVLVTTETARGLIVNIGDVNFDSGKYTLEDERAGKPREDRDDHRALSHASSCRWKAIPIRSGTPTFNQTLSENRANTVMQFLTSNGVPAGNATAMGYGATNFVADNGTPGRQGAKPPCRPRHLGRCYRRCND